VGGLTPSPMALRSVIAPLGRRLVAREARIGTTGGRRLAAVLVERRRPKRLDAATRLARSRPGTRGLLGQRPAAMPPIPRPSGMSEFAARWMFGDGLPEGYPLADSATPAQAPGVEDALVGAAAHGETPQPTSPDIAGSPPPAARSVATSPPLRGRIEEGPRLRLGRKPASRQALADRTPQAGDEIAEAEQGPSRPPELDREGTVIGREPLTGARADSRPDSPASAAPAQTGSADPPSAPSLAAEAPPGAGRPPAAGRPVPLRRAVRTPRSEGHRARLSRVRGSPPADSARPAMGPEAETAREGEEAGGVPVATKPVGGAPIWRRVVRFLRGGGEASPPEQGMDITASSQRSAFRLRTSSRSVPPPTGSASPPAERQASDLPTTGRVVDAPQPTGGQTHGAPLEGEVSESRGSSPAPAGARAEPPLGGGADAPLIQREPTARPPVRLFAPASQPPAEWPEPGPSVPPSPWGTAPADLASASGDASLPEADARATVVFPTPPTSRATGPRLARRQAPLLTPPAPGSLAARPTVRLISSASQPPPKWPEPGPRVPSTRSGTIPAGLAFASLPEADESATVVFPAPPSRATGPRLARQEAPLSAPPTSASPAPNPPPPAPLTPPTPPPLQAPDGARPADSVDEIYEQVVERLRRDLLAERERMGDLLGELP